MSTCQAEAFTVQQRACAVPALATGISIAMPAPLRVARGGDSSAPLPSEAARPGAESGLTRVSVDVPVGDITRIDSVARKFPAPIPSVQSNGRIDGSFVSLVTRSLPQSQSFETAASAYPGSITVLEIG